MNLIFIGTLRSFVASVSGVESYGEKESESRMDIRG